MDDISPKHVEAKPAYHRPELVELDVGKTAAGVIFAPQPESVSYIS